MNELSPDLDNRRAFHPVRVDAFLAEEHEATKYVWDQTLPRGGTSLFCAQPKVGKTTTVQNIAVRVARDESFLSRETFGGPVVLLALEEKRAEVHRQFRNLGCRDEPIFIHTGPAPENSLEALRQLIGNFDPVLVIIDTLQDFSRVPDLNDYSGVHQNLAPVRNLARDTGTHILLVHHNNKADQLLGSTQLVGIVDTLLVMRRQDQVRTLKSIQRYGQDLPETVLTLNGTTGMVSEAGIYGEVKQQHAGDGVLAVIGNKELTEDEIKILMGGDHTLVAKALRTLLGDGKVLRSGSGKKGNPYRYKRVVEISV